MHVGFGERRGETCIIQDTRRPAPILHDNLSVPYGLIRTVRHYLEFVGVLSYIRGLKSKGVRLDLIVVALCTYTMHTSNSMNACAEWLKNPAVRRQLGFSPKDEISQKTLNRAIVILGENREGIIAQLWKGIKERFEIDDYDISLEGSAVVLYGPKSEYGGWATAGTRTAGSCRWSSWSRSSHRWAYRSTSSPTPQHLRRGAVPGLRPGTGRSAFET